MIEGPVYGSVGSQYEGQQVGDNVPIMAAGRQIGLQFVSLGLGLPNFTTSYPANDFFTIVITEDELDLLNDSRDKEVRKYMKKLDHPRLSFTLNIESQNAIDFIGAAQADAIFDELRHDEILLGIPRQ